MKTDWRTLRRGATVGVLVVSGGGVAIATWVSGEHGLAIGLVAIYAVAAVIAYIWSGGKGDVAAILRVGGDERQRGLDRDATAITGLVVVVTAVIGAIIQTARSADPGARGVICAVRNHLCHQPLRSSSSKVIVMIREPPTGTMSVSQLEAANRCTPVGGAPERRARPFLNHGRAAPESARSFARCSL